MAAKSWESPQRRAEAIASLLDLVGLKRLWTENGPTPEAETLRRPGALPDAPAALLEVAFDLWNGTGRAPLANVAKLDPLILQALGELFDAIGSGDPLLVDWCDGALALKLRALAWSGNFKDPLGNEDVFAEDALLRAAEIVEGMLEGVPMLERKRSA